MKTSDLYNAISATREPNGDIKTSIDNQYDRERLAALITRDEELIVELLQDAADDVMIQPGQQDSVTNAILSSYYETADSYSNATSAAFLGAALLRRVGQLIEQHIDRCAEEWIGLADSEAVEAMLCDEMDRGYESLREGVA